ncbi:hypothetical protein ACJIZ3_001504 [Penstemon smallii]|uniref:ENT domain-containing protein n=1 Tax=Penstemon smallii TaxID=265156 RepID=A0ABD3U3T3_9LAMI
MRFKKGDKYDSYPDMASEQMVETVSRKFVRPFPPLLQGAESFFAGDIVEVFYEYSWKVATILKAPGGKNENKSNKNHLQAAAVQNQYLVRLLGCSLKLILDRSNIRMRQTWQDNNWSLMGKTSQGGEEVIVSKPLASNCYQKMNFRMPQYNARAQKQPRKDCRNTQDDAAYRDSPMISSRSLRMMSPYGSSTIEAHHGHIQKLRAIEKNGKKQRVVAAPVLEKVDAVSYPREFLGENNMHGSFKITSNGYNQIKAAKLSDVIGSSGVRSSELNSSDSDACSVGSCSITSQSPNNYCSPFIPVPCQETDILSCDAESCYGSGSERRSGSIFPYEEVEVSIHRIELHAYSSTLGALYASGPLSWEQEALLTNLRIMLHISNDEHLMEVKHLISAKTALNVR